MTPLSPSELAQFTGSTEWFRHSFNRAVIYTEGVRFLAARGGAFWLIDAIATHIGSRVFNEAAAKDDRIALMHFWKLAVNPDQSARLTAVPDSGEPPFIDQLVMFTDFPLSEVDVWAQGNGEGYTLMLPSEY
ncbi:hypothetical protein Pan44_51650 [Caulifigura coniformis]|uniref:DUF6876 domain-containing protein n=1 Tax=Caulifigura coniformis TaxID=2527983 RepID=A0A517SLV2_9PLAN|nr:DUF6876 family protein [Caulifigura coniformis]QDT57099.1 hypothetical protein Pan44_51650 [Caulifigura coniformis]